MAVSAQTAVAAGVLGTGALLGAGAVHISSDAGYSGVGPNFLPWVVAAMLLVCGVLLLRESLTGGFRVMEEPEGDSQGHWPGFIWLTVGLLANAALITTIGFILSCALCFACASRGFKGAEGQQDLGLGSFLKDWLVGMAIAAPVYWMFTKLLAINLPGLTSTGWL